MRPPWRCPGVSFVNSQILFVDEQKFFASSEGSRITQRLVRTYPQFTHHRRRPRHRRLPDARRRRSRAAARLRVCRELSRGCSEAEKAGHEVVEKLKAKPIDRRAATTSSSIRRICA